MQSSDNSRNQSFISESMTNVTPNKKAGVNMIPVFEYYFYPEFAIKSGKIKENSASKIHFLGLWDIEKERLRIGDKNNRDNVRMDEEAKSYSEQYAHFIEEQFDS